MSAPGHRGKGRSGSEAPQVPASSSLTELRGLPDTGLPASEDLPPSELFDGIAYWLLDQGLGDRPFSETLRGFGRRLVDGGVPVCRISTGGLFLHPVFGAMDTAWDATHDLVTDTVLPRSLYKSPEFQNTPFFQCAHQGIPFQRFRLDQTETPDEYPILESLRASGITDYLVFYRDFGRRDINLWQGLPQGMEGALGSFATRRTSGFEDREIAYLRKLTTPLSMVIKSKTRHRLTTTLLDTYLGSHSSSRVLKGLIERGSGQKIDCAIWLSDLRQSTQLADTLGMEEYLPLLNSYFDCTAGAVLDHGGEVLKFIGDAVLAIFPFEEGRRPPGEMCRAALRAAREAHARTDTENNARRERGLPEIKFGVALHAGTLMYGNVGTDRRLDFTVIGPAANEVARLEEICKSDDSGIAASRRFAGLCPGDLGDIAVRDIGGGP